MHRNGEALRAVLSTVAVLTLGCGGTHTSAIGTLGQWWLTPEGPIEECKVVSLTANDPGGFGTRSVPVQDKTTGVTAQVQLIDTRYHPHLTVPSAPGDSTGERDRRVSSCRQSKGPQGWVRQEYTYWHVLAEGVKQVGATIRGCAVDQPCDISGIRICHHAPPGGTAQGQYAGDCSASKLTGPGGCAVCQNKWLPE
jgi:hypothetical protein